MIPSLSKASINVKYEDLHGLTQNSMDVLVNKDNFMLINELNRLKVMIEAVEKVKEKVYAITHNSNRTITQSDFVTMMEEMLGANDYELLKEYNNLRQVVTTYNTFKEFLEAKYGSRQTAFLFEKFSDNAFELLEDYNRIVDERKFARLSLFLRTKDINTRETKYIPLEYDHHTGLAGINLQKSMDFQRIYLGHRIVGFADEAEYINGWYGMPDGVEPQPIGWESMEEYMNSYGPHIFYIAAPGAEPRSLFYSIDHNRDDGYEKYMKLDGLWSSNEGSDDGDEEEEQLSSETVYPGQCAAYYGGPIEELTFADDSLVTEDVFPGLVQIMEDETLFNPVFWYEFDLMDRPVVAEGEEWHIRKLQNVGLAYYAIPSKLLAYAVDQLTKTQPVKKSRQ
jgi:hypothetical protein